DRGPGGLGEDRQNIHRLSLLADPLAPTEQPLGPEQQHENHQGQSPRFHELRREPQGGQHRHQAHGKTTDHRPICRAQTTEDHSGKHQQQQTEPHLVVHDLVQSEEHTTQRGQPPTQEPHVQRHPVHVDTRRLRQVSVVGHRPHRRTDTRELQQAGHQDQYHDRHDHDHQVARGQRDRPEVHQLLHLITRVPNPVGTKEHQNHVPQYQSQTDRDDEHLDHGHIASTQRKPQIALQRATQHRNHQHGHGGGRPQRDPPLQGVARHAQDRGQHDAHHDRRPLQYEQYARFELVLQEGTQQDRRPQTGEDRQEGVAQAGGPGAEEQRHHRAEGDHVTVREVDELGGPEDQRQADRGDRDDQSEEETHDRELRKTLTEATADPLDL